MRDFIFIFLFSYDCLLYLTCPIDKEMIANPGLSHPWKNYFFLADAKRSRLLAELSVTRVDVKMFVSFTESFLVCYSKCSHLLKAWTLSGSIAVKTLSNISRNVLTCGDQNIVRL